MIDAPRSVSFFYSDAVIPCVRSTRRIFYVDPAEDNRPGWYLNVRGGRTFGPFRDKAEAQEALARLVRRYQANNDTGGR